MTLTETIHNALETGGKASEHAIPGTLWLAERERKKDEKFFFFF